MFILTEREGAFGFASLIKDGVPERDYEQRRQLGWRAGEPISWGFLPGTASVS